MLYLLDANTLIHAKNEYYPLGRVPEFWTWLAHQGGLGNVKVPREIYEEFSETVSRTGEPDELAEWANSNDIKNALLLKEQVDADLLRRVMYGGYLPNPTDKDIVKMGKDPFLIAYALSNKENRCVVSGEFSKPSARGARRKVPDVCGEFGIQCIFKYDIIEKLDFTTSWEYKHRS